MLRAVALIGALTMTPALASAQQPCTTDARRVVSEIYRHMLERGFEASAEGWVQQLANGSSTVRDIVREVAKSPEHVQRFGSDSPDRNVAALYRHLLGRQPDDAGLRGNAQLASERGLDAVIDRMMASPEYQSSFGAWGVPGSGGLRYCGTAGTTGTTGVTRPSVNGDMRFRGMDRNRDGAISRNEWRGNSQSFNAYDWNNDGMLSGDEVRPGARPPDEFVDDYAVVDRERFEYLDYNNNGRIDSREWDGTPAAFDRLDRNNDGTLTRVELNYAASASGSGLGFANLDTNNDGRITLEEWRWSRTAFDRQDLNNDGALSRREYREVAGTSGYR